jgi:hypothetical protein
MAWAFVFAYAASFAVIEVDIEDEVAGDGIFNLMH